MASQTAAEKFKQALARIEVDWLFEAMPLLDEVIEAQPEWREPYVQRARIRRRLKNYEGAIADYAKALKLEPTAQTYLARALVWLAMGASKCCGRDELGRLWEPRETNHQTAD